MDAKLFLRTHLTGSSLDLESLRTLAEELGVSWHSISKAKRDLRVKTIYRGYPARVIAWKMPAKHKVSLEEKIEYAIHEVLTLRQRLKFAERSLNDLRNIKVFTPKDEEAQNE